MNYTIEQAFFKPYQPSGVVGACFDLVMQRYDLGYKWDEGNAQRPQKTLSDEGRGFVLPKRISEAVTAFDESILPDSLNVLECPLMLEISSNLDECTDQTQTERYIFSLLKPFKGLSDKIHPAAEINRLKRRIVEVEGALAVWQRDEASGVQSGAAGQIEACRRVVERANWQAQRLNEVANRYREICNKAWEIESCSGEILEQGQAVECYLDMFLTIAYRFGSALDALLLTRGINLLWYQRKSGIYLFEQRDITGLALYCGSRELAEHYISKAQPQLQTERAQPQPDQRPAMPKELDSDEARGLFDKTPYCRRDGNLYRWTGTVALFGYFVESANTRLDLRPSSDRTQWEPFKVAFQMQSKDIRTARQAVNDYKNKGLNRPDGWTEIDLIMI